MLLTVSFQGSRVSGITEPRQCKLEVERIPKLQTLIPE